jgi:6-pyruvoyl-tetrahydropterin synthase
MMNDTIPVVENDRRVALVLSREFAEGCISLQAEMPVWIIDSSENKPVVEQIRSARSSNALNMITTFQTQESETLDHICKRIVQSLDDHHNEQSQSPAYCELLVIGVSLGEVHLKPFLELGFDQFEQMDTGFIARKSKCCPQDA